MRQLRSWSIRFVSRGLLAASIVALVPTAAQALPRSCDVVCRPSGSCNWKCNDSPTGIYIITCGEYGVCAGARSQTPGAPASGELAAFEFDGQATPDCAATPSDAPVNLLELVAE